MRLSTAKLYDKLIKCNVQKYNVCATRPGFLRIIPRYVTFLLHKFLINLELNTLNAHKTRFSSVKRETPPRQNLPRETGGWGDRKKPRSILSAGYIYIVRAGAGRKVLYAFSRAFREDFTIGLLARSSMKRCSLAWPLLGVQRRRACWSSLARTLLKDFFFDLPVVWWKIRGKSVVLGSVVSVIVSSLFLCRIIVTDFS